MKARTGINVLLLAAILLISSASIAVAYTDPYDDLKYPDNSPAPTGDNGDVDIIDKQGLALAGLSPR